MRRILGESIPVLTLSIVIGILAGQILSTKEESLLLVPLLLVLIPPINNAAGMLGSVLGARVSTGLHSGSLFANGARQFRRDVLAIFVLGIATFALLGALAFGSGLTFAPTAPDDLADVVVAVIASGAVLLIGMVTVVIVIGSLSFRLGWDPDNVIIPVVTATGDILGIGSLILMVQWVGL